MPARTFTKRPLPIEAIRFDGTNHEEIRRWQYRHVKQVGHPSVWFAGDRSGDERVVPEGADAAVYDYLHRTWVGVYVGQWIMRGTEDEFYPCADSGDGTAPLNYEENN